MRIISTIKKMSQRPGVVMVFRRELERICLSRIYLLLTLIFPLVSFIILATIFNAGSPRNLPIAIYDADNTVLSRMLVRHMDSVSSIHVAYHVTDFLQGKELILSGKIYALVVIPRDFEHDHYRKYGADIACYYNNQLMSAGSIVNRGVVEAIKTVSMELDQHDRQMRGEGRKAAIAHAEPIKMESRALFNPYLNYLYFLVGALMPTMLQIFVILAVVYAIGIELKERTAGEWLEASGNSMFCATAGKLLPYFAIFFMVGLMMNTLLFIHLGVPLRGSISVIAVSTVLLILAYQAVAMLIISVTANLRVSLSISAVYSGPAFAFAGITFPVLAMPPLGKVWGAMLPISHYLIVFLDQCMRGAPVTVSIPQLIALACFLLTLIPAVPRLGIVMRDEKYWGRK